MALKIFTGQAEPTRKTSDGVLINAQGMRDGTLFTAGWIERLTLEGRVFAANLGTLTSPATFAAGMVADEADFLVDIPDGIIGIPISIEYTLQTGTTGVSEVCALASSTLAVGTSGTSLTVYNVRLDSPIASRATVWGALASGGNTTPYSGNYYEFFRDGYGTDPSVTGTPSPTYRWSAKTSSTFPVIVDGGSITIFHGAAAATGFITVVWAELPESYIK